ncbi:sugar diacid recognition domain-containing protein [Lentibacillus cibarius]|nr:sugar diacid recognition domain-containing protein [Lentibacillus cibarius]
MIGITGEIEKVKPFGEIVRKMTVLLINENNS